jgi:crotonobetainyl-CoA:carnitine CoA-transferase CaiB-like acyl-CoA transferase
MAERAGQKREITPQLIPAAVCDYIAGYLAAAGAAAALLRRYREGGSWLVQVSLASTAAWLSSLGRTEPSQIPQSFDTEGLDEFLQSWETVKGTLTLLGPIVRMSRTQPAWRAPPPETGADPPSWLTA